ncbi:TPA: molybdate ABC transporter substrate-binding protein [Serratia liquefaciens]
MIKRLLTRNIFLTNAIRRGLFLLVAGMTTTFSQACDVSVMSTVAFTPTLGKLTEKYENDTGNKLNIIYDTIANLKKQLAEGKTADVIILSRPALNELLEKGKIMHDSIVNVGSSYVAVGIRANSPLPDISTTEKLKSVLLSAKAISYADPAKGGASGVYFANVIRQLGLTEQLKSKTILVPSAEAGEIVAQGRADIAVAQASEIAAVPGTRVVGPLPGKFSRTMVFSAGIGSESDCQAAARALITFLTSPFGVAVLRAEGMDEVPGGTSRR